MEQGSKSGFGVNVDLIINPVTSYRVGYKNTYTVECFAPDGSLKWVEKRCNLVTEEGLDAVSYTHLTLPTIYSV